uniref:SAND domain-containing protein n=1 Tax=Caenorhabditis japonica TaxID=281687 RepID=A0A8R1E080_CAEJA
MKRDLADMLGDKLGKSATPEEDEPWKKPKLEDSEDELHSLSSPTSSTPPPLSPTDANQSMPKLVEITCGALSGILHMEHFICPGIREKCISSHDNPGELMTPVEFTIKADKIRQKDWKGAIKHQGRMLRTLMEFKQLDFYNHETNCSYKCHSRNYITRLEPSEKKEKVLTKKAKVKQLHQQQQQQQQNQPQPTPANPWTELLKNADVMAYLSAQLSADLQKRQEDAEMQRKIKQQKIQDLMVNDPPTFWTQAFCSNQHQIVINALTTQIGAIVSSLTHGRNFADGAVKLSQILQVIGVGEKLAEKIAPQFVMPAGKVDEVIESPPTTSSPRLSAEQNSVLLQNLQNSASAQNTLNALESNNNTMSSSEKLDLIISQIKSS